MSKQEEQTILEKWQETFDWATEDKHIIDLLYIPRNSGLVNDAKACPNVARKLSNMLLDAIDNPLANERRGRYSNKCLSHKLLEDNTSIIFDLGKLDSQIYTDFLKYKKQKGFTFRFDNVYHQIYLLPVVEEGKLSAKLLYDDVKASVGNPPKKEDLNVYQSWDCEQKRFNNYAGLATDTMGRCVVKDPSLAKDFLNFAAKFNKADVKLLSGKTLYKLSTQLDKMPEEMAAFLTEVAEKKDIYFENLQESMFNVVKHDAKYLPRCKKAGFRIEEEQDAVLVAKIYEALQQKAHDNIQETDFARNTSTDILTPEERKIADVCEELFMYCSRKDVLAVKLSKNYPFSTEKLNVEDNEYVRMCLNNLEHPEKENIRSILNRLEETGAKDHVDFMNVVDFVHRRDMYRKICNNFNAENGEYTETDGQKILLTTAVDSLPLAYAMAESGIRDKKTAEKVVELFIKMNERPHIFGSSYNKFYPDALKKMVELEDWMLPVVRRAVECKVVQPDNLGNPDDLFAACKAWKINPNMPKAVAEQVGEMPLSKRMIAGAITDRIRETVKDSNMEIKPKELIPEFWKEMARAQEMTFAEAMKTYIPDTKINRKRFTAAMLEEMGIESSPEKFKNVYQKLEYKKRFEKFLAVKGESQTVVSVEQMLKLAELKKHREEVRAQIETKPSANPRRRLVDKGLLPSSGKFGEGHQISIPVKDMSQFKSFTH